jgi:prolyl oligopeptidase
VESQRQIEIGLRRVILLASSGADVLVCQYQACLALPTVPIPLQQRVAENLTAFLGREWSEDAISLFALNPQSDECQTRYEVAESIAAQPSTTEGFRWVSVSSLKESQFEDARDCEAIAKALAQCEHYAKGRAHSPFGQLGWFTDLREWVRDQTDTVGLTLSGRFTQLNASPAFSLIRFETNGPAVWFKAIGEPNLREYPITLALAQYFPAFVPRVVAKREDWNGWLALEAEGAHPVEDSGIDVWRRVTKTLGKLQTSSIGQALHLLNVGCRDARACSLLEIITPFFEVIAEFMKWQTKKSPPALSRNELQNLRIQLQDVLAGAADSEIPDTIGHFDFNPGNIIVSHDRCVFLDWAEACVGSPFLTFRYMLEHLRRVHQHDESWERTLTADYADHWSSFFSSDEVSRALRTSSLLAVFAYAACGDAWRDPASRSHPEIPRLLRSLTRRMKREADLLVTGDAGRCVAMSSMMVRPSISAAEPVTEVLHGVSITDPYRWLEDQNSAETRVWIDEQRRYARAYLDGLPGRQPIRERVSELVDVEIFDSFLKSGNRYFFRKRRPGEEQPSIYFREGADGEDVLLVDPRTRGTGNHTAIRPLRVSPQGHLLLYEVKQGGERTGIFEILDVASRTVLPDALPHGYLRGFAFAPDGKSFYYIHEPAYSDRLFCRAVFHHVFGTRAASDTEIFRAGEDPKLRLVLIAGERALGFLIRRFLDKTYTDFYLWSMGSRSAAIPVLRDGDYTFAPRLLPGRILALVDDRAPNFRIVDVQAREKQNPLYSNLVPEADAPIRDWTPTANHILVSYIRGTHTQIVVFDQFGKNRTEIPFDRSDTVRIAAADFDDDEALLERESFTRPIEIIRCSLPTGVLAPLVRRSVPFSPTDYGHIEVEFRSKDGTRIPMCLVGRRELLAEGTHPVIMTAYGGFGVPMTPQFSVLVLFLLERGCLFALPNIRGGAELGSSWHAAARRRNRQVAIDDFLCAAEWLIHTGRTTAAKLGIFGGSNSGLLVGAAMTQRPELFRAVLCMAPLLDMLRYHLFDNTHIWTAEFGTSEDPVDFAALLGYSPYHAVRNGTPYPATMIVSGDADRNCNPLHARKMTAALQAASSSDQPIFLDYSEHRGHSPVLPLTTRMNALTDRLAFLCSQLGLVV